MYGLVGDVVGIPAAMLLIAALLLVTLPLACRLSGFLNDANPVMTGRLGPKPRLIKERGDPHAVTGAATRRYPANIFLKIRAGRHPSYIHLGDTGALWF
jgi:hypothetical protein